jgi:hypothetical protein
MLVHQLASIASQTGPGITFFNNMLHNSKVNIHLVIHTFHRLIHRISKGINMAKYNNNSILETFFDKIGEYSSNRIH